ncbi:MAG: methylated-DNA--[protein]-cysteine S-methyltransferase [Hydrogenophilales bacterium]|nr:methylated-DNA--[protein]-cysteine S-methyltransferase [Hydrogenophilales bacterium]
MKPACRYAAKYLTPFAVLGIRAEAGKLAGIDFLPRDEATLAPSDALTRQVCEQIEAYLHDPDFQFDLPLRQSPTPHQMKVWQALLAIPRGQATTYGELARQLVSSPRAVGQACGSNPLPLIIPCHRVVAKNGAGGFMHHASGAPLAIKDWLLRHEGYQR